MMLTAVQATAASAAATAHAAAAAADGGGLQQPQQQPADARCSLLGVWAQSLSHSAAHCECDSGWTGATCSVADLKPLDLALGYHNSSAASWGGRPVQVLRAAGCRSKACMCTGIAGYFLAMHDHCVCCALQDPSHPARWHLVTSQFSHRCPLALWTNNSQVVRAVSVVGCSLLVFVWLQIR